jgi:hypothetical protein
MFERALTPIFLNETSALFPVEQFISRGNGVASSVDEVKHHLRAQGFELGTISQIAVFEKFHPLEGQQYELFVQSDDQYHFATIIGGRQEVIRDPKRDMFASRPHRLKRAVVLATIRK